MVVGPALAGSSRGDVVALSSVAADPVGPDGVEDVENLFEVCAEMPLRDADGVELVC